MAVKIADHWFERTKVDDDITLLWEPHVDPLIRCNIWHIRGRDKDMLVDTGMGICSLRDAARDLLEKEVIAVATHSHYDHTGSMYEFDVRAIHECEERGLEQPGLEGGLRSSDFGQSFVDYLADVGYPLNEELITAYPHEGYDPGGFATTPMAPTWLVREGDVIDLGSRAFEVLHLPGHSPGSIGLWESGTGTLFSGDAIYDGPLLDGLEDSNIADYVKTMERLQNLPVTIVHAGHDPSFGRQRLNEIASDYLDRRRPRT